MAQKSKYGKNKIQRKIRKEEKMPQNNFLGFWTKNPNIDRLNYNIENKFNTSSIDNKQFF
jgi:hypothetical protein